MAALERPGEPLLLSIISVWEIGLLVAKRRLRLHIAVDEWVRINLEPPVVVVPMTPAIALLANALPGGFHGDPADRIIMASALAVGARLATADGKMLRYAKAHGVAVVALD